MNLRQALRYGVVQDFHSGGKRDQFAGLLEQTAAGLDTGILADFLDDHDHPLAPVFRRIANGEAQEGAIQQHAEHVTDNTYSHPNVEAPLFTSEAGKGVESPYASIGLFHHFEQGPIWQIRTHLGWRDGEWPVGRSFILPATEEEIEKVRQAFESDGRPKVAKDLAAFLQGPQHQQED